MATTSDYLKLAHMIESGGLIRDSRGILSRYWTSIKVGDPSSVPAHTNKLSALAALVRQQQKGVDLTIDSSAPGGTKRVATPIPAKNVKLPKLTSNSQINSAFKEPVERLQVDGVQLFGSLVKLFRALLQSDSARFIYQVRERQIRYIRLDIDADLQKVIESSKAFIMVGGTM